MAELADPNFTPQRAVQTLESLGHYEEALSARAGGLTWMIWGISIPGIFLSYGAGDAWLAANGYGWLLTLLWAPWIAAATLVTNALWRSHSIVFRTRENGGGWVKSLLGTLVFFALAGIAFAAPIEWSTSTLMILITGLFTILIGAAIQRAHRAGVPAMIAGALLAAFGTALGLAGVAEQPANLLGAAASMAAYFGAGIYPFVRG